MQLSRVHRQLTAGRGVWALAIALTAVAGIASGRWLVPAGGSVSSAPIESRDFSIAVVEQAPADAGHVIGMTFAAARPEGAEDQAVSTDSPGEGHVIGVRFR